MGAAFPPSLSFLELPGGAVAMVPRNGNPLLLSKRICRLPRQLLHQLL
mgnify:CR=1 FL=1